MSICLKYEERFKGLSTKDTEPAKVTNKNTVIVKNNFLAVKPASS